MWGWTSWTPLGWEYLYVTGVTINTESSARVMLKTNGVLVQFLTGATLGRGCLGLSIGGVPMSTHTWRALRFINVELFGERAKYDLQHITALYSRTGGSPRIQPRYVTLMRVAVLALLWEQDGTGWRG